MPVTINIKPRNPMPIHFTGHGIETSHAICEKGGWYDASTQKPIDVVLEHHIDIKDIEKENSHSESIDELTHIKHRKLKRKD